MPPSSDDRGRVDESALSRLTGVRSGKKSYYVELRRTEARMTSAVRALEGISAALSRTRDDPRALLEEVLRAAAGHLHADWTMIALRDGGLAGLDIRFLALGPEGEVIGSVCGLPWWLVSELARVRSAADTEATIEGGQVRVPMTVDGVVLGRLIARYQPGDTLEHADLWVLRILANQAAVSMHNAVLYRRELLDAERHRIALELHDSVAQYVLSAGLAVDVCRAEAADRGETDTEQRLTRARDLIAKAGDQVRSAIYALHHGQTSDEAAGLPELLQGLAAQHRPGLEVEVRVSGQPVPLNSATEHELARIAGEALFNVSIHAKATRAVVRLGYGPGEILLWISDNGAGDPALLRRVSTLEARCDSDGRHQGLANMAKRAADLSGGLTIRRSGLGGILIDVRVPVPGQS